MDINEASAICIRKDLLVYPVGAKGGHKIEYSLNGISQTRYNKILKTSKEVNKAMEKTYIYHAKKLLAVE